MVSKNRPTIIIAFNITMVFLLFLSTQITLIALNGMIVEGTGIVIDFRNPQPIAGLPPPPETGSIPNYPLFVFIFTLIADPYFLIRLKRSRK